MRTLKVLSDATYIKSDFFRGQVRSLIGYRFLHHLLAQVLFKLFKDQKAILRGRYKLKWNPYLIQVDRGKVLEVFLVRLESHPQLLQYYKFKDY